MCIQIYIYKQTRARTELFKFILFQTNGLPRPENDIQVTDLEEECPNIENLVIKTKSLDDVSSPKISKPKMPLLKSRVKPNKSPEKEADVTLIPEKAYSACSTPRTADRSATLFAGRVPTPRLKNQGSRHHFDRTTIKSKSEKLVKFQYIYYLYQSLPPTA